MCDIKNKWDIFKAIYHLKRKDIDKIPMFTYLKTDNLRLEFDEVPPSWCIDGDELPHDTNIFEIKVNKDNYMLLPEKNIDKLFEHVDEKEDLE